MKLVSRKLQTTAGNLQAVAAEAIRTGHSDEETDMTDILRVLSRVCAGRGKPVPLYRIQQDERGRGFMADPRTRKSELNKQWGFDIRQQYAEGDHERSEWWIVCGPDGMPTINHQASKRIAQKPAGWHRERFSYGSPPEMPKPVKPAQQPNLFHTSADTLAFCRHEMGAK